MKFKSIDIRKAKIASRFGKVAKGFKPAHVPQSKAELRDPCRNTIARCRRYLNRVTECHLDIDYIFRSECISW